MRMQGSTCSTISRICIGVSLTPGFTPAMKAASSLCKQMHASESHIHFSGSSSKCRWPCGS